MGVLAPTRPQVRAGHARILGSELNVLEHLPRVRALTYGSVWFQEVV